MPPIITIVGKSKSGKTTLIEKLIPELKRRGYRVGTLKHAFHRIDIDKKGKDSWRHKHAGADMVLLAAESQIVMVKDDNYAVLDDLEHYFEGMDIVITEGFKRAPRPKIEVLRTARSSNAICSGDDHLIALVTDADIRLDVPSFGMEDISELTDFIENRYLRE